MRDRLTTLALLAPALAVVTACGTVPMAFVFYYSTHDTFGGNIFVWVGLQWYREVFAAPEFHAALARSLGFAALSLAIQIPLGVLVALRMPRRGLLASALVIAIAIPLLTPSIVVGYLWKVMTLPQAGLLHEGLAALGIGLDMNDPVAVWAVLALMDAWHWTGLVVLLCHAALGAIPDDHYRAARIDGASGLAVFRYVQLPRLRHVLLIAVLLRFMDSFIIYTETYVVTRGGPGVSTTFLSHELVQTALIQFDLGEGGAMSAIYFAIVLCVAWVFFRLTVPPKAHRAKAGA